MAISVVICGLVRDHGRLSAKLTHYCNWRDQGHIDRIIYATWIGEIDRYRGLRRELEQANVAIVEIEEPRLVLKGGHQLHQMLAYYYGLSLVEDETQYVLKTRVDLADNTDAMVHEFVHGTPPADDFMGVGIGRRILVENSQMLFPFLNGDAQFFGRKCDLLKLINLSAEMELVYNRLAVEQSFFFEPFKHCRVFQEHFYWNLPHISAIAHKRAEQIQYILHRPEMARAIKGWWLVLDAYFKVNWGEAMPFAGSPFRSIEEAFAYDGEGKFIGAEKSDVIAHDAFVKALVAVLPEAEKEALKAQLLERSSGQPLEVAPAVFDVYEAFRKSFSDLPAAKATPRGSAQRVITGAAQHFFVKDPVDSASTRYHEQITNLRRENDYLKKQLNISLTHSPLHRLLNRALPPKFIIFMRYKMPWVTSFYMRYLMRRRAN